MKMNINKSMEQKDIWIDYELGYIWRYSDEKFYNKKGCVLLLAIPKLKTVYYRIMV